MGKELHVSSIIGLLTVFLASLLSNGSTHVPLYDGTDQTLPKNLSNNTITDRIEEANLGKNIGDMDSTGKPLFEGDISLSEEDKEKVDTSQTGDAGSADVTVEGVVTKRKAIRERSNLWTSREVPLVLEKEVSYARKNILAAITEIQQHSCVRFRDKRPKDKYWIRLVRRNGCFSQVGRQVGVFSGQELSIGDGCNEKAIILHELMHALGFWHEQARTDRDQYVNILWENVRPGEQKNFNRYNAGQLDFVGGMYDFESAMHYGNFAFSKNNKPTMIAIKDPSMQFGRKRSTLSKTDILQLKALYDCASKLGGWSSWSDWGPCNEKCAMKRERFCTATSKKRRKKCPGADSFGIESQTKTCDRDECNVDVPGHWGRWAAWGKCSRSCGRGYKVRSRLCDNPVPRFGGHLCKGSLVEVNECHMPPCMKPIKRKLWDLISPKVRLRVPKRN